jgi:GNAT superfamily N-acetyltransferase
VAEVRVFGVEIRILRYDHPDAVLLTDQVQQEYVVRYGNGDETPMDAAHFDPPQGLYALGYLDGVPVASGGWRCREADATDELRDGDAEIKRMYTVPSARGRGLARLMLRFLEAEALRAGRRRMVLETGTRQPEAIALYRAEGYRPIAPFGYYRDAPESRYFGKELAPVPGEAAALEETSLEEASAFGV